MLSKFTIVFRGWSWEWFDSYEMSVSFNKPFKRPIEFEYIYNELVDTIE